MATHSSVLAWRIPGMGGAWWAAVYGVAQSQTRLKRLSSDTYLGWLQMGKGKPVNTPIFHAELLPMNLNPQRGPHTYG